MHIAISVSNRARLRFRLGDFEHDRKGTVVYERNFHIGTENTVTDRAESAFAARQKIFVYALCMIALRRVFKARSIAAAAVGIQRKLRYDQKFAGNVFDR